MVLEHLLANGTSVVAVLWFMEKSKAFLERKCKDYVISGRLEFAEIPDMTVPHAFDALAEKLSTIIHVATPLSLTYSDYLKSMTEPT